MNPGPDIRKALCVLALAAAVCAAFSPVLANGFTNWDDPRTIVHNPLIGVPDLPRIFTDLQDKLYMPLVKCAYVIEHWLGGGRPAAFHAASLLLHALNAVLAFLWLSVLTRNRFLAFAAALAFGLHPLQVEPVAWASAQNTLWCAVFFQSAMLCYLRRLEGDRNAGRAAAIFFLAALLSKQNAVILPAVFWLLRRHQADGSPGRPFPALRAYFAVSAAWLAFSLYWFFRMGLNGSADLLSVPTRLAQAARALLHYLGLLCRPAGLSPLYPYPSPDGPILYWGAAVAVLMVITLVRLRANRTALYGLLFLLANLALPLAAGTNAPFIGVADRYAYLASLGFFVWLFAGLERPRKAAAAVLILMAFLYAPLSHAQSSVWRDSRSLWSAVIARYPGRVPQAYYNMGRTYFDEGDGARAAGWMRTAKQLDPALIVPAYYDRSAAPAAGTVGRWWDALNEAVRQDPRNAAAHEARADFFAITGEIDLAFWDYDRAIRLAPARSASAYYNRGVIHEASGRLGAARADFRRTLAIDPRHAKAGAHLAALGG